MSVAKHHSSPELQRLLASGPGTLPDVVAVDVSAIVRFAAEQQPTYDVISEVQSVVSRSHRSFVWIVAALAVPTVLVDDAQLHVTADALRAADVGSVIEIAESFATVLRALAAGRDCVVVSAGVDQRPYELVAVAIAGVAGVLDVTTGILWDRQCTTETLGAPEALPMLEMLVGEHLESGALAKAAARRRLYRDAVQRSLEQGDDPYSSFPPTIRATLDPALIEALVTRIRGESCDLQDDPRVVAALSYLPRITTGRADTAYVLTIVESSATGLRFTFASIQLNGVMRTARDHDGAVRLLSDAQQQANRWYVARALDVLGAMADAGLAMPQRAVDAGLQAYILNPDAPPRLDRLSGCLSSLPESFVSWLGDTTRKLPRPSGIERAAVLLPILDADLEHHLRAGGLQGLSEDDLAMTLPLFARAERRGLHIRLAEDWNLALTYAAEELEFQERRFAPFLRGVDCYGDDLQPILERVEQHCSLTRIERASLRKPDDVLARFAALGFDPAQGIVAARGLVRDLIPWMKRLRDAHGRVRGLLVPQKTGRWGYRDAPLSRVPKRSDRGRFIRAALVAPPGQALVVFDFNAFEGRLLASLSGDPILLKASAAQDFHSDLAEELFGIADADRGRAKKALYAAVYGQTLRGFVADNPELPVHEAVELYKRVSEVLCVAFDFQKEQGRLFRQHRQVSTRGGWRRFAPTPRKAFSTIVQGLAADVFRWCFRRLDAELERDGAALLLQVHDEGLIGVPLGAEARACATVVRVAEHDLLQSGLVDAALPMRVKVEVRQSWQEQS